ncbi:MAG: hypothetical protein WAO98_01555 [Alphaproteobacteria bacterium]
MARAAYIIAVDSGIDVTLASRHLERKGATVVSYDQAGGAFTVHTPDGETSAAVESFLKGDDRPASITGYQKMAVLETNRPIFKAVREILLSLSA